MRRLPLALTLLLLAPAASAQVYKWTDSQGTVHYSETPPPRGTSYKHLTSIGMPETPAPAPEATPKPAGSERETQQQAPMTDTPENRAKLCSSLKANLELLRGGGPVVMEQAGKQTALEGDQRSKQIASAEQQYGQYCGQ